MYDTVVAIRDVTRRYLQYNVTRTSDIPSAQLIEWLHCRRHRVGIIYCVDQAETDEVADLLQCLGFNAAGYHEYVDARLKRSIVREFNSGHVNLIALQTGHGGWIDRSDIDFVFHTRMPSSLSVYLQDTCVADRGENCAECVIFYGDEDVKMWKTRLGEGEDSLLTKQHLLLGCMKAYCETTGCRHLVIMKHLKPSCIRPDDFEFLCHHCDNCLSDPRACFGDDVRATPRQERAWGPVSGRLRVRTTA